MAMNRLRLGGFRILPAAIIVLAGGLFASAAHAQGTNGQFPDPISTRNVDEMAARLSLSPQQRQAIELVHAEYRNAFAALRAAEIEQYLQSEAGQGGRRGRGRRGFDMNLDRDEVVKSTRDYQQILTKIERLDQQLFEQMQPVLTEQQAETLPRLQLERARDRFDTGPSRFARFVNPGSRIDLSELFRDLELGPEDMALIDPLIAQYERDLTNSMRTFHSDARQQQGEMIKRLEQAGITEESMQDRRSARRAMQTMREIWEEMNRELSEQSQKISDLNQRTYQNVVSVLPPEQARQFRSSYVNRVYGEASPVIGRAERAITNAMEIEDLPAEILSQVRDLLAATVVEIDRLTDSMVSVIDENRETSNVFDFDRDARREYEREMEELRETREAANEQAITALHALLGEEHVAQLDRNQTRELGEGQTRLEGTIIALNDGGGMFTIALEGEVALADADSSLFNIDPYIPGPISGRDVSRYADLLEVEEPMKPVLDSLHADYQEQFKVVENAEIKQARDIRDGLWEFDEESRETTPPDEKEIENLYNLRKRALDAIRALDGQFFDDVSLAFVNDENSAMMKRIRLDRERQMYNRSMGGGDTMVPGGRAARFRGGAGANFSFSFAGAGGSNESSVDLAKIVSELDLNETQRTAIDGILATYEQGAADAFRRAFEANMAVQEARDKVMAENMEDRGGRGRRGFRFDADDMREAGGENREVAERAEQEMANLNRQTLGDLMARLDPVAAQALEDAYNRQAFPEAYMDPRNVEPKLNAALALDDLTSRQQQDLQDLSLTHRSEYRETVNEMIEVIKASDTQGDNRFEGMQQRMQSMERIRFTRNDLNDRTLALMRTILTEEQVERLGGLEAQSDAFQTLEVGDGNVIRMRGGG